MSQEAFNETQPEGEKDYLKVFEDALNDALSNDEYSCLQSKFFEKNEGVGFFPRDLIIVFFTITLEENGGYTPETTIQQVNQKLKDHLQVSCGHHQRSLILHVSENLLSEIDDVLSGNAEKTGVRVRVRRKVEVDTKDDDDGYYGLNESWEEREVIDCGDAVEKMRASLPPNVLQLFDQAARESFPPESQPMSKTSSPYGTIGSTSAGRIPKSAIETEQAPRATPNHPAPHLFSIKWFAHKANWVKNRLRFG